MDQPALLFLHTYSTYLRALEINIFYSQVKPKMVMTVFAVLMSRDFQPNMDSKK